MRRALLALVLVFSSCSAESQICGRMETLCGTKREECSSMVKSMKDSLGDEGVSGMKACFSDAKNCSEASGCMTALGFKSIGADVESFFKGLGKGLEQKK